MQSIRWYSPGGDADQGGNTANDNDSNQSQEGQHQPGNTPLDDQEELADGYIHGHAEQDEAKE
ncbi:hypothetical protein IC229_15465 [Spirosoma sp. BT702]|uniref:Uncharacterized protein n=1 Tax=Spirosoma profusum TaxID=2771354 RepID=A0A926Y1T9_9BACT|nr:hypothetical protein [Spirosoma profusum]MBD2702048.1 hypothetical protein [Spirosoma profusum]